MSTSVEVMAWIAASVTGPTAPSSATPNGALQHAHGVPDAVG
ncbi:hypothetical protein [Verticiella sediminum]|nr:hypothetical protein [Verticiella sediminum]